MLESARRFHVDVTLLDPGDPLLAREGSRLSQTRVLGMSGLEDVVGRVRGPRGHAPWLFRSVGWSSSFVVWFEQDPGHVYDLNGPRPRRFTVEAIDSTAITDHTKIRFLNQCPSGQEQCFAFGENINEHEDAGAPGGWVVTPYGGAPAPEGPEVREVAAEADGEVYVRSVVRGPREELYFRDQLAFSLHAAEEAEVVVFPDGDEFVVYARSASYLTFVVHVSRHDASGRRLSRPTQLRFRLGTREDFDCVTGLDEFPVLVRRGRRFAFAWTSQVDVETSAFVYDGRRAFRARQERPPGTDPDALFLNSLRSLANIRGGALVFEGDPPIASSFLNQ